jgi:hypothetical protein
MRKRSQKKQPEGLVSDSLAKFVMDEGPEAFRRFDDTMRALLAVPHLELKKREQAYKKKAARTPRKYGPHPRTKFDALRDAHRA